jgi:hypothetical protein
MNWIENATQTPSAVYDKTSDRESEGYYLVYFDDCMGFYYQSFQMCRWDGSDWRTPYLNMRVLYWLKLPELPAHE